VEPRVASGGFSLDPPKKTGELNINAKEDFALAA